MPKAEKQIAEVDSLFSQWEKEDQEIKERRKRERENLTEQIKSSVQDLRDQILELLAQAEKFDIQFGAGNILRPLGRYITPVELKKIGTGGGKASDFWVPGKTNRVSTAIVMVLQETRKALTINEILSEMKKGVLYPKPGSSESDAIVKLRAAINALKKSDTITSPVRGKFQIK